MISGDAGSGRRNVASWGYRHSTLGQISPAAFARQAVGVIATAAVGHEGIVHAAAADDRPSWGLQ